MSPAYIPTPIYFGAVIDTTCMLWQQDCGVHGSCWEYDVTSLRFVYFGLAASLKCLAFLFIVLTWYSIKYREERVERWLKRHLPPSHAVGGVCHPGGLKGHARTRSCPVNMPARALAPPPPPDPLPQESSPRGSATWCPPNHPPPHRFSPSPSFPLSPRFDILPPPPLSNWTMLY